LTETDAPFGKIDSPIEIQKIVESLSKIRSEASSTVIYQNFKNILNN
jgi:Tat protein secretion system quality control protein TatD with DNase activity